MSSGDEEVGAAVEHDDDRHTADAAAVSPTFPWVNVMVSSMWPLQTGNRDS